MRPRKIPVYPLTAYSDGMTRNSSVFVGSYQDSVRQRPNRLSIHRHDYFELFLLEGNGEHFNDFATYPITTTTVVCVSPGQVHFWKDEGSLRGPMICFTQDFAEKDASPGYSLLQHSYWFPVGTAPIMKLSGDQARETRSLIDEMQREFSAREEGSDQILRLLLQALLYRISRFYPSQSTETSLLPQARLLRDFLFRLEQSFRAVTSVTDYANLLRVSTEALSEAVKAQTGKTVGTLIRQRILLEAQRLLLHTSLTVSEIAYNLNFADPSYFIRFFRRLTGKTPIGFRTSCHLNYYGTDRG
jgi:AraC family transcriptional activator of pobA